MANRRTVRAARWAVIACALLVAAACQPTFTGPQFRDFYNRYQPAPNTVVLAGPPPITGNGAADARIRAIAERRGYQLRSNHVGPLVTVAGVPLDPAAGHAFALMIDGARRAGYTLTAAYGYRSIDLQRTLFMGRIGGYSAAQIANGSADGAINAALQWVAAPGYSKHQTGYTIDLRAGGGSNAGGFGGSGVAGWLAADNYAAAKSYGFIPSYPPGAPSQGPEPEPWEYVYVGSQALACSPWLVAQNDKTTFDLCQYPTQVSDKYFALGGPAGFLSRLKAPEADLAGGRYAQFAYGYVFWSFFSGAHEVHGSILAQYVQSGGPVSALGFPTTDEQASSEGGRYAGFAHGMIVFRPGIGPVTLSGLFAEEHSRTGGVAGPLGYPRALATTDGTALLQEFDGGRIYGFWPNSVFQVSGSIWTRYSGLGGPAGPLGYPTSEVVAGAHGGSLEQSFQHGRIYVLAPDRVGAVAGPMWDAYQANGGSTGHLGLPTGDESIDSNGVRRQSFEGGTLQVDATGRVSSPTP